MVVAEEECPSDVPDHRHSDGIPDRDHLDDRPAHHLGRWGGNPVQDRLGDRPVHQDH